MPYDKWLHVDWIAKLRFCICLILALVGFTAVHNDVSADELYGMIRWHDQTDITGAHLGRYLRQAEDNSIRVEFFKDNSDFSEALYVLGYGTRQQLPDRPGEIYVVISNHEDAPIPGSLVTVYLVQPGKYLVVDGPGSTMRFQEEPGNFRWRFSDAVDDPSPLRLDGNSSYALRRLVDTGQGRDFVGAYSENEKDHYTKSLDESGFYPLPQEQSVYIVPRVLYQSQSKAIQMVQNAGLVPEVIPQNTHDPDYVGYVTIQEPEHWVGALPGSVVQIGVPQEVTQTVVPNIIGLHIEDAIAQIQAAGLMYEPGSTLTDDVSRWNTIESVYYDYMGDSINLFETNYPDLRDGETVIVKQGSVVEVRIFSNPAANPGSAVSSINLEGTSGGGFAVPSMQVALMAPNGSHYVTATSTSLKANVTWIRGWEKFQVETLDGLPMRSGTQVSIRTAHGRYWMARPDGRLTPDATQVSGWEAFRIYKINGNDGDPIVAGDQVAFLGFHGKWVSASGYGGGGMAANGPRLGGWEKFSLTPPQ